MRRQLKSAYLFILFGVISIVLVACSSETEPTQESSSPPPIPPPPPTLQPGSGLYLDRLANNAIQVSAAFARIDEHMSRVWPVRSELFDAFSESELSEEIITSLGEIVQIRPPVEFEPQHEILRRSADTVVEYSRQFEQALQDRDLGAAMVAKANFTVSYQRLLLAVPPPMCMALSVARMELGVARDVDSDVESLCTVSAFEQTFYDSSVEQLFKEFRVEFNPRVSSFPSALTSDERFAALAGLNKEIEGATQVAAAKLDALSPPGKRADDHKVLLTFLEDIGETATAITLAGESRDISELDRLFEQSGTVYDVADGSISCDYSAALLHGYFSKCAS